LQNDLLFWEIVLSAERRKINLLTLTGKKKRKILEYQRDWLDKNQIWKNVKISWWGYHI